MFNITSLSEWLLFSTVRVETKDEQGNAYSGTGFFFEYVEYNEKEEEIDSYFIVTNKHVIADAVEITIKCHAGNESNEPILSEEKIIINLDREDWFLHPDKDIDLCIYSIRLKIEELNSQGTYIGFTSLSSESIPKDEVIDNLFAVEDILMCGYPTSLYDKRYHLPLIRKGITASHPAIDFGGKSWFVADIACFEGSSGSPIVILNEGFIVSKKEIAFSKESNRLLLLGVLFGEPKYTQDNEIIIPIDAEYSLVGKSQIPIPLHLGYAIKAKELIILCKIFFESND